MEGTTQLDFLASATDGSDALVHLGFEIPDPRWLGPGPEL